MKTVAFLIALSTVLTGAALAQPPERGDRFERMAILLDLNEYQKTEVQRIFEEQRAAAQATREANRASGVRPTREERAAQRQQARESVQLQLQSVLTQEQMTKLEVLRDEPRGRGRRGGDRRGQEDSVEE